MSQVCSKCSRVNPSEAVYCHFDGALLQGGPSANGGPVNPGTAPFNSPFVFPSGQTCQNFDQLAMACQNNWDIARDLLQKGYLHGFFGGLGRVDLAMAAQEAAQFPDKDRGLDRLLSALPSEVLNAPKLKVEPTQVNLGLVPMGTDRKFDLQLDNQGMRLIYGSVASDSKWMTLGDAPGAGQKLFQFGSDTSIPIHIHGDKLRASPKPLLGQLFIESNGGPQISIKVRLEVPIKPFTEGVLAGAKSPRDVAVKAKSAPKEAAALFESGAVANWFKGNGWIYPVQGPAGSGLGAVQQFFEALGLAKPPKVLLDKQAIQLSGAAGQALQTSIKVETPEKRPVYAHASADEHWLDVGQTKIEAKGRIVVILVNVASVPARPGQTLSANIRVAANGNQRFKIPVTLTVQGAPLPVYAGTGHPTMEMTAPPILAIPDAPALQPAAEAPPIIAVPEQVSAAPVQASPSAAPLPIELQPLQQPQAPIPQPQPVEPQAIIPAPPVAASPTATTPAAAPPPVRPRRSVARRPVPAWVHVLPLGFLALVLVLTAVKDAFFGPPPTEDPLATVVDRRPRIGIFYDWPMYGAAVNKGLGKSMRFGLATAPPGGEPGEQLTFHAHGHSNSTMVKIDREEIEFGGGRHGVWVRAPRRVGRSRMSQRATFKCDFKGILVTQTVELAAGEPFLEKEGAEIIYRKGSKNYKKTLQQDTYIRGLDTCLVRYEIKNTDDIERNVSLRIVLDTLIGINDGVPISVPGIGLVQDKIELKRASVPDFIQVLQKPNLNKPGIVAHLNLKIGGGWAAPNRVLLTRWPGHVKKNGNPIGVKGLKLLWDIPLEDVRKDKADDSCVVLYWKKRDLQPGKSFKMGFTYGLGHVTSSTGKLSLNASTNKRVGDEIEILARIGDDIAREVTLKLPVGLKLLDGEEATKRVPKLPKGVVGRAPEVTWRARAVRSGNWIIEATANDVTEKRRVTIKEKGASLFGN